MAKKPKVTDAAGTGTSPSLEDILSGAPKAPDNPPGEEFRAPPTEIIDDPTVGEFIGLDAETFTALPDHNTPTPLIRSFEMSDEPIPIPTGYTDFVNAGYRTPTPPPADPTPKLPPSPNAIVTGEVIAPRDDGVVYESRIRITNAWQYRPRELIHAPDYVDRNWLGYADTDPLRGIEAGPCLRVPAEAGVVLCRVGDWIVTQEMLVDENRSFGQLEVWPKEQFERMFMVKVQPGRNRQ